MKTRHFKQTNQPVLLLTALLFLFISWAQPSQAASRLIRDITFEQPNGTVIELRGEGNEYRAVYETLDGYTVIFVPEDRAYHYARLSQGAEELISSGIRVGEGAPETAGLIPGLRINKRKADELLANAREESQSRIRLRERWDELKEIHRRSEAGELSAAGLRPRVTVGTKVGLTLLIDFDDQRSSISRSNVVEFLNGDNYRGFNNRGSVKEYFHEVSGGKLTYTNVVVGYIRIPNSLHPRAYYNDLNRVTSFPVNELIRDAIQIMTNQPNYMSEVVPQLERALSVNEAGEVLALNVFVAGNNSGVWAKGLWPHMSSLYRVGPQELWPGGKRVNLYQMTTMETLQNSTFCHETGHLLCAFPDVYDYDDSSAGGAAQFCLMAYNTTNPQHPSAYLKLLAGWATVTDLSPGNQISVTLPAPSRNGSHFLRYKPDIVGHEYYLVENRHKSGRDSDIPGSGILVWHIDELGDNSNENLLPNSIRANYEITLMQADGLWHLQKNTNPGDLTDSFYSGNPSAGYRNRFSDETNPSAAWWNGTRSGLVLRDFGVRATNMTLTAEIKTPVIHRDPLSQAVLKGDDLFLSVQMRANEPYSYNWYKGISPVPPSARIAGVDGPVLAIYGVTNSDAGSYSVVVTDSAGTHHTSRVAQVTISTLRKFAAEDIGDGARMPGSTAILNNAYEITAGGSGPTGAADGVRFLYERFTGDFDARVAVAHVRPEDVRNSTAGAAGLMVRAGLEAGSPQATVLVQPGFLDSGTLVSLARLNSGESVRELGSARGIQPRDNYVRVRREGLIVTTYYSTNGTRWEWLQSVSLPLGSDAYVGIAATSYDPVSRIVAGLRTFSINTNTPSTIALNTVTNTAQEGTGQRISMLFSASRNGPWEVPYVIRDTTANGVLYEQLSGTITIPAGTNVAALEVDPINNETSSPPHVVNISITGSGVVQASANGMILDDDERGQGLLKELYVGIPGTEVRSLFQNYRYPGTVQLSTVGAFESTIGQHSGQILSGYVTPPTTGEFIFYLASANASELWLSPTEHPSDAIKIAEEFGANTKRNWPGSVSRTHISRSISLTHGKWYSIRAIHKAGFGTPHLAVAWQPPGAEPPLPGSLPITGEFLSWSLPRNLTPAQNILSLTRAQSGALLLQIGNDSTNVLQIEASSNLRDWQPLAGQISGAAAELLNLDPSSASSPHRFYRVSP